MTRTSLRRGSLYRQRTRRVITQPMPAAVRQDVPQTCKEIEYITENNSQEIDYVEKKTMRN